MVAMPLKFPVPTGSQIKPLLKNKAASSIRNVTAFRACYQRFEDCLEFAHSNSNSSLMETASNFVLDFDITAKRTMDSESTRYRLFQLHFLKGQSRDACCAKLNLTHWAFAAEVISIEQALGAAFSKAGLFPLAPYFSNCSFTLEKIAA